MASASWPIAGLLEWRERRGDQELVLLADRPHPGLGRPLSALAGFLANARALVRVLVDPDVHELVQSAEFARPAGDQRRELLANGHGLAPCLHHFRDVAGRIGIDAHLVEVAPPEVAAAERLHERR